MMIMVLEINMIIIMDKDNDISIRLFTDADDGGRLTVLGKRVIVMIKVFDDVVEVGVVGADKLSLLFVIIMMKMRCYGIGIRFKD